MLFVGEIALIAFAFAGRWIQLHPERLVSKGQFLGQNTIGARLFRIQAAILGALMVFGGTTAAVRAVVSPLTHGSAALEWTANLIGVLAGVLAVAYVRREVKSRPPYFSNTPFGWWP
jgi:hypothetical protein